MSVDVRHTLVTMFVSSCIATTFEHPLRRSHSGDIKDIVAPAGGLELLDALGGLRSLFVPDFDNAPWSIDVLEDTLSWLCNTNSGVEIWIVLWGETSGNGSEEGEQIVWICDASGAEAFAGVEQLSVGGVEKVGQSRSLECLLVSAIDDGRSPSLPIAFP